jgi:hypothetical protein
LTHQQVERGVFPQALKQIRVGDEEAPKGHQIGAAADFE